MGRSCSRVSEAEARYGPILMKRDEDDILEGNHEEKIHSRLTICAFSSSQLTEVVPGWSPSLRHGLQYLGVFRIASRTHPTDLVLIGSCCVDNFAQSEVIPKLIEFVQFEELP